MTIPATAFTVPPTPARARVAVENFATTVVLIGTDDRPVRGTRRNVIWREGETDGCVNAADEQLRTIGYQRASEWVDGDGNQPRHAIGDRNGWYYATVTPLPA